MQSGEVQLVEFEGHLGSLGSLVPFEFSELPFAPQRLFTISQVPTGVTRGSHAHRVCHQLLVAVQGSVSLSYESRQVKGRIELDKPDQGLWVRPEVWLELTSFSEDAVLIVFASEPYSEPEYIRDRNEFEVLMSRTLND